MNPTSIDLLRVGAYSAVSARALGRLVLSCVTCIRREQGCNSDQRERAQQHLAAPEVVAEGTDDESSACDTDQGGCNDPAQITRRDVPVRGESGRRRGHRLDVVAIEQGNQRAQNQDAPMQWTEPGAVNNLFNIELHLTSLTRASVIVRNTCRGSNFTDRICNSNESKAVPPILTAENRRSASFAGFRHIRDVAHPNCIHV
jgi:hypothetical protein